MDGREGAALGSASGSMLMTCPPGTPGSGVVVVPGVTVGIAIRGCECGCWSRHWHQRPVDHNLPSGEE